jgi:acetyl-CoA carboxylase biotin carboxylase subunit
MKEAGLPVVPAVKARSRRKKRDASSHARIGYPLMVKASAGGGGRGMRIVRSEAELGKALETASTEAAAGVQRTAVSTSSVTSISQRHIEIQVLADEYGECIHLGEARVFDSTPATRKLMEEAPSTILTPELTQDQWVRRR